MLKDDQRRQQPQQQPNLPSYDQVDGMLKDSIRRPGQPFDVFFGDDLRSFNLKVIKDPSGICRWWLYRIEEGTSSVEWNNDSNDSRWVHRQLTSQFPNWGQRSAAGTGALGQSQVSVVAQQASGAHIPAVPPPAPIVEQKVADGDLTQLPIANVMRSIATNRLTGKLSINDGVETAVAYFHQGSPVHCLLGDLRGDFAIIELLAWREGTFEIISGPRPPKATITKKLDQLLGDAATFKDQIRELVQLGVTEDTALKKQNEAVGPNELMGIAPGVDAKLWTDLYFLLDGITTIGDLAKELYLVRAQWVPAVFGLLQTGLAIPVQDAAAGADAHQVWGLVDEVANYLFEPSVGVYTYPAFLFMAELEFVRSERYQRPFAMIVVHLGVKPTGSVSQLEPLPVEGLIEVSQMIGRLKRKQDFLGIFEETSLAILLLETDLEAGRTFATRLATLMVGLVPAEWNYDQGLAFSIGVAGAPDEAVDLEALIVCAKVGARKYNW